MAAHNPQLKFETEGEGDQTRVFMVRQATCHLCGSLLITRRDVSKENVQFVFRRGALPMACIECELDPMSKVTNADT